MEASLQLGGEGQLNPLLKRAVKNGGITIAVSSALSSKTFKMAVGDGGGSTQQALGEKFAELLREKTDGKYTAKLFLNSQLGSEQSTVNDVAMETKTTTYLNTKEGNLPPDQVVESQARHSSRATNGRWENYKRDIKIRLALQ